VTGLEFKATLKQLGLSQAEFARWISVDRGTVNRWCRGDVPVPRYAEIILEQRKRADALDLMVFKGE